MHVKVRFASRVVLLVRGLVTMTETTSFTAREKILSTISTMSNAKWAMAAKYEAQALT
jgi:hypothetical protein